MRWQELLFLHWPVHPGQLRPHLPADLELETFDGHAWLGVVPFVMAATKFRWLPPMPTAHYFPECNVRTYVRHKDRSGVWFFSLDAASRLAVVGARVAMSLPYFYARMRCQKLEDRIHYRSLRSDRRAPPASFSADWQVTGEARPATSGTLQHFLTERYCLYSVRRGKLAYGEIAHRPWQLSPVALALQTCDMTQSLGLQLAAEPCSALAAEAIDVAAWPLRWSAL